MQKTAFFEKLTLFLLAGMLAAGSVGLTVFPSARFSADENRLLADRPVYSPQALRRGTYTAAWETYATERLPWRKALRGTRAAAELCLGKREVNGVVLGNDGSLLRRPAVQPAVLQKNLRALCRLREAALTAECPLTVAAVPRRIDVCTARLPALYAAEEAARFSEAPACPAVLGGFAEADWFRTDHHWNAQGAYRAYAALGAVLGYQPYPQEAFTPQTVSESFFGTSDAAAGILGIFPDTITLLRYEGDEAFTVKIGEKHAPFAGFYDFERLSTRDGYGVFLGGNHATLTVDLGENDSRPRLLLIKDSFANALIPFLARHFRILAIDPRYGTADTAALLRECDGVLMLCGVQTLSETPFMASPLR